MSPAPDPDRPYAAAPSAPVTPGADFRVAVTAPAPDPFRDRRVLRE